MTKSKVYAVANASVDYNTTFGHVNIFVYELFPYRSSCNLKITCQIGGLGLRDADHTSYCWDYGISNDYGILSLAALQEATSIMRRIKNNLAKEERAADGEFVPPSTFGGFALRILRCAGVKRLVINDQVNKGFNKLEDLPTYHVVKGHDYAVELLNSMEKEAIKIARQGGRFSQW